MEIIHKANGTTITRMTREETGLRCPIALMQRKIADKKIKEAEKELRKKGIIN